MAIPSISVAGSGDQAEGPHRYRLARVDTYSTNATSSTNWGRHGHTLDLFLGKAGRGFENVVGNTAQKMGFQSSQSQKYY